MRVRLVMPLPSSSSLWWLLSLILLPLPLLTYAAPPALLLATEWQLDDDPSGWWLSEKFDGIRGYWDGEQMWSRGGGVISLPAVWYQQLPPFALDGELWAGYGRFDQVQRTVLDQQPGSGWQQIRYLVFDLPAQSAPFPQRLTRLTEWLARQPIPPSFLQLISQRRCHSRADLQRQLQQIVAQGGEGVMLRADGSPYRAGRSGDLRKLKPYQEGVATVIGYRPGHGQFAGMTGALLVELESGVQFAIGSGLTAAERQQPPAIGSRVTFRHWGWTVNGKPRFAVLP